MNGAKENSYHCGFSKESKKLRLLYPCQICGENNFSLKEVHHIDHNKKNGDPKNLIVLCKECHLLVHQNRLNIPDTLSFVEKDKILIGANEKWISRQSKIRVIRLDPKIAMRYRRRFVKGWIVPGACNIYIGMIIDDILCGVLGFQNPDMGTYDLFMKADTVDSNNIHSIDLLLYCMRSKDVKNILERKFSREINSIYSTCFSPHAEISRYRRHGDLVKRIQGNAGFVISYLFKTGEIPSLKAALAEFFQKHKEL